MKHKYLRVETKPKRMFGLTDIVAQVDVNHLNKRGIDAEWDILDKKYPKEYFNSSLITVGRELRIFANEPEKYMR